MSKSAKPKTVVNDQPTTELTPQEVRQQRLDRLNQILATHKDSLLENGEIRKVLPGVKEMTEDNSRKTLPVTKSEFDPVNGAIHLQRMKLLREMLKSVKDIKILRGKVKSAKDHIAKVFASNMITIFREQRELEKVYQELNIFFNEARLSPDDKNLNVYITNASFKNHYPELMDPEKGLPKLVPNHRNFDIQELVGLIVVPEWLETAGKITEIAKIAERGMAHVFISFKDCDIEEAWKTFEEGEPLANLKNMDRTLQYVSLIGNHICIRRSNRYENGATDGLYTSPAMVKAAKVYKGDVLEGIHIPQAGDQHRVDLVTPDNSEIKLRWPLTNRDQFKTFNRIVVPLVYRRGIIFWGVETLYDSRGNNEEILWEQYTVKRSDQYISKVILDFLNGCTYRPNDNKLRDDIRRSLQQFLNKNVGGPSKMLQKGLVVSIKPVPGEEDKLDIVLELKYKQAVRYMNLHLKYDTGNERWDLEESAA